jgi:hypothetical protein
MFIVAVLYNKNNNITHTHTQTRRHTAPFTEIDFFTHEKHTLTCMWR